VTAMGGGARGLVCPLLPKPSLYMGGGGSTLPPPQGIPRAAAKGGEAVAARAGGAQPPPKTLTLAGLVQGPRAPPFFLLP
jgi:hypothetical protein